MADPNSDELTGILARWSEGEDDAAAELLPLVYDELRRLARSYLRKERSDHTLQATALVHEAYLKLADRMPAPFRNRVHFFAATAKVMRQVLVDYARQRAASKRGGDKLKVILDEGTHGMDARVLDLLVMNDALERLGRFDPRKARIVELRFFGGLSIDDSAAVLGVSGQTVINETRKARAWLFKEVRARGGLGA